MKALCSRYPSRGGAGQRNFQIQVPSLDCTGRSIFWDGLSRLGRTRGRSRIRKENNFRRGFALPGWRFITRSTRSIRRSEESVGAGRGI